MRIKLYDGSDERVIDGGVQGYMVVPNQENPTIIVRFGEGLDFKQRVPQFLLEMTPFELKGLRAILAMIDDKEEEPEAFKTKSTVR